MTGLPERPAAARRKARTAARVLSCALAAGLLAGCSDLGPGGPMSYAAKVAYLEKTARRGVEANHLLKSEGVRVTRKECQGSYGALQDQNPPNDLGTDLGPSDAWLGQIRLFFIQSCVTGLPKPVPGQAPPSRTAAPAPSRSSSG